MSDLHGCIEEFKTMLQTIEFNEYDTLYILGDLADRGKDGINLYLYIMQQPNMKLILGNHDAWLLKYADSLMKIKRGESLNLPNDFYVWLHYNGGTKTALPYMDLEFHQCYDIKTYLENCPKYLEIKIKNQKYLLVHAGVGASPESPIEPYNLDEHTLLWEKIDLDDNPYPNRIMIVGHRPTFLRGKEYENKMILREKIYHIDCGCVFGRALGCLRLEDKKEFYVPSTYEYLK